MQNSQKIETTKSNDIANLLNKNEMKFFMEEIDQQNELEKNTVYTNAIGIISKFFVLLNLSDSGIFENDSILLNSIMRLMRKNVQVLSKENVKIVSYESTILNLKQFFKTFKVIKNKLFNFYV